MGGEWKNEIFDCFSNMGLCCKVYFCFPCAVGKNAEAVGAGSCIGYGIASMLPGGNIYANYAVRKAAREKVGEEGSLVMDCVYGVGLAFCSQVQIAKEFGVWAMAEEQTIERE